MPRTTTSARKSTSGHFKETEGKRKETEQEREQRLKREAEDEDELLQLTYSIVHLRNLMWPTEWRQLDLTGRLDMLHQRLMSHVHADMGILNLHTISRFERNREVWAIVSGTDLCTWHTSNITITLCLQFVSDEDQSVFLSWS
jgi:hypothetical protein